MTSLTEPKIHGVSAAQQGGTPSSSPHPLTSSNNNSNSLTRIASKEGLSDLKPPGQSGHVKRSASQDLRVSPATTPRTASPTSTSSVSSVNGTTDPGVGKAF